MKLGVTSEMVDQLEVQKNRREKQRQKQREGQGAKKRPFKIILICEGQEGCAHMLHCTHSKATRVATRELVVTP